MLLCTLLLPMAGKAQNHVNDAALWLGIGLEHKLSKKFEAAINLQTRLNNNVTQAGTYYTYATLGYKLSKNIKVAAGYGFRKVGNPDESYGNWHRMFFDINLKKDFGRWELAYRNRTQMRMKDLYSSEDGSAAKWVNRNRLQVQYTLSKQTNLFVAEEVYYTFSPLATQGLSRLRTNAGIDYKLNRSSKIQAVFIYRHELNAKNIAEHDYVYSLTYVFSF